MNEYVGNPLQIRGAEQYVLQNGKGDGMHFLYIRNGLGLEVWISLDRCGDISRVTFKGDNMGYFSPCGYVAPHYFDDKGKGFLKSFTSGFFTTCGLSAVGSPCFTEWKMMGKIDYVLGLEPGNCTPDGRDIMRKQGKLKFLESGESALTSVKFNFLTNVDNFEKEFNR